MKVLIRISATERTKNLIRIFLKLNTETCCSIVGQILFRPLKKSFILESSQLYDTIIMNH